MASYADPNTGRTAGQDVNINETDRLIASDKVEGTDVYDASGEHIGHVRNFMVDKRTGQAAYAVMSFGGFLGMGERYFPLPWDKLDYDTERGGFVVDVDPSQLEKAPSYGADEDPWVDPAFGPGIYGYYGLPYYI